MCGPTSKQSICDSKAASKNTTPQGPELTPDDIVKVLRGRGWEVKIVKQSEVSDLVKVGSTGLFKCVDGRPSDHPGMNGPKALGGIYAIASNRSVTSIEGLKEIVTEVQQAGFVPSVHGDGCAVPASMGCGFYKLWRHGKLEGIAPPKYDAVEGMTAVLEAGGVYEELIGVHEEKVVMLNFVPNTTLEPKADDQRFVVDAWVASEFNLDILKYLVSAVSTVEQLGGPKKTKLVVPDDQAKPELTPEDIVQVLEGRGWKAKLVKKSDVTDLVRVSSTGLFKCVDGRPSNHPGMDGPKALGGVYAIASNRGVTSIAGLKRIVAEVREAGFIPSVHGDGCAHPAPMGCGFYKLWRQGKLDGIPPPRFDSEEGMAAVLEVGGVYEELIGVHEESVVMLNFVRNTTLEPKAGDQRFVVDAWVAGEFNLDIPKYLVSAVSTVEQLGGPKKVMLVVDDDKVKAELTPNDVVKVLRRRGWEAEIVEEADVSDLVKISSTGLFKCVDGRPSDHLGMDGPKALGGIYAIASNRGVTSIQGLKRIVEEVKEAGYIPSVHGDSCAHPAPMGCGFYKLWRNGKLDGIAPPKFDSEEGMAAVLQAGGVYEQLIGAHEESEVVINFVPKTTLKTKAGDQRFVVDAWVAGEFDLDIPKYLVSAASTVEQLGGPKKVKIVVPNRKKRTSLAVSVSEAPMFRSNLHMLTFAVLYTLVGALLSRSPRYIPSALERIQMSMCSSFCESAYTPEQEVGLNETKFSGTDDLCQGGVPELANIRAPLSQLHTRVGGPNETMPLNNEEGRTFRLELDSKLASLRGPLVWQHGPVEGHEKNMLLGRKDGQMFVPELNPKLASEGTSLVQRHEPLHGLNETTLLSNVEGNMLSSALDTRLASEIVPPEPNLDSAEGHIDDILQGGEDANTYASTLGPEPERKGVPQEHGPLEGVNETIMLLGSAEETSFGVMPEQLASNESSIAPMVVPAEEHNEETLRNSEHPEEVLSRDAEGERPKKAIATDQRAGAGAQSFGRLVALLAESLPTASLIDSGL